ncbi:glycosyl hydrolase%2C family protein 15 [Mycobacterium tuberculosis]|nr:glycosyl hydrolase%2C family protein 15 [Mycobacterium tuberculosis]
MSDPAAPSAMPTALRDYAFIADGERGVLVGPHGEYAWMCFPHWDSAPAFASLLGGPGGYLVQPVCERFVWGGYYEDRGLIWRSRWVTGEGSIVECREALARPARRDRAVLLRRCRAVRGPARLRALLDVRAGGTRMHGPHQHDPDWTARSGGTRIRWRGADEAVVREGPDGGALLAATFDLAEGESRDADLVQEGFVYRYRVGGEPLGVAEGSFTLCGLFLALAEHRRGENARALGTFERTRSGSATSGLFSEEYDVRQRQLRGNIPQAFVHAQLLEAAARRAGRPAGAAGRPN